MGMAEAIRVYLGAAKRKTSPKVISEALREGGLASTAMNFDKTLITTMHRMKDNGILLKFKEGWDLAGAYPESFRQRVAKDEKPKKILVKLRKKKPTMKAKSNHPSFSTDAE
jgi:hypothetical protein